MVRLLKKEALAILCDDTLGRLADYAENAADFACIVPNGRVGDVEKDILRITVPLDVKGPVLGEHGFAGLEDATQKGLEIVPQLRPVLPRGLAERTWMLVADCRRIGIVIERYELRTP